MIVGAYGTFTISLDAIQSIPQLYDVLLIDNYNKDTTSLRQNPLYPFAVISGDTGSYSKRRFNLMVRQNPVYAYQLLNFTASKTQNGRQTEVDWTTKNEENYTNFTVQRSTDNGQTYQIIGAVTANGSGSYSFTDKSPLIGTNLYRLEQENINDSISYSKVVPLIFSDNGNNGKVLIYPNPAKSIVNLDILAVAPAGTTYQIIISNSTGLVIKRGTSTQSVWSTNISELLPGTYLVMVLNQKDQTVIGQTKFVKL
jgi:trimeric autotransporter adhesin